jgi:hypothetical protein
MSSVGRMALGFVVASAVGAAAPGLASAELGETRSHGGRGGQGAVEVSYCPVSSGRSSSLASAAGTSEKGWPPKECLKIDKGSAGESHTIRGDQGVHNWLLGGYGNDTIIGGNIGDVIWADYQPSGFPAHQTVTIHAGNGRNVIYANDTVNYRLDGHQPAHHRACPRVRDLRSDPLRIISAGHVPEHHQRKALQAHRLRAHQPLQRGLLRPTTAGQMFRARPIVVLRVVPKWSGSQVRARIQRAGHARSSAEAGANSASAWTTPFRPERQRHNRCAARSQCL